MSLEISERNKLIDYEYERIISKRLGTTNKVICRDLFQLSKTVFPIFIYNREQNSVWNMYPDYVIKCNIPKIVIDKLEDKAKIENGPIIEYLCDFEINSNLENTFDLNSEIVRKLYDNDIERFITVLLSEKRKVVLRNTIKAMHNYIDSGKHPGYDEIPAIHSFLINTLSIFLKNEGPFYSKKQHKAIIFILYFARYALLIEEDTIH